MATERRPMTKLGKELLEKELERLIHVERPKVIKAIEEARSHGDLSENADYDAAKEQQGHIEGRIAEINERLALAQVIEVSTIKSDKITFGAHVVLKIDGGEESITYQIVGEDEADAKRGKISIRAPLTKKLIGRKKGDVFEFYTANSEKEYEILDFYFK